MSKRILYTIIFLLSTYSIYSQTKDKESEIIFEATPEASKVVVEGDTLVYSPEVLPSYPGGEAEIDKHFQKYFADYSKTKSRKYNKAIWLSFVIRGSGDIGAINLISNEKPEMTEKLTKALKSMQWTPAVDKGRNVATIGDFYFYFH